MKINKFIDINKIEIEDHIKELTPSFDYQTFIEILISSLSELEPIMVSSKLTDIKIDEILKRHLRKRPDPYGSYFNNDSILVLDWLFRYTTIEDAFYHARESLKIINNKTYYGKAFPKAPETMSYKELNIAIEAYNISKLKVLEEQRSSFDTNDLPNPLIFDEKLLLLFSKFDGLLWNTLDINWFRQRPEKIMLKRECTQPVFCYFFNQFKEKRNKEFCPSPTVWLPSLFTPKFNYSNHNAQIALLTETINKNYNRGKTFNMLKGKIDNLVLEIEKNLIS